MNSRASRKILNIFIFLRMFERENPQKFYLSSKVQLENFSKSLRRKSQLFQTVHECVVDISTRQHISARASCWVPAGKHGILFSPSEDRARDLHLVRRGFPRRGALVPPASPLRAELGLPE